MPALPLFIAIPTLLTAVSLEAQFQDRLYPFIELTDEMRARIDLKDGSGVVDLRLVLRTTRECHR